MCSIAATDHICTYSIASLVPSLPRIFNIAHRERREPGKIYHVRDVGVEATWKVWGAQILTQYFLNDDYSRVSRAIHRTKVSYTFSE